MAKIKNSEYLDSILAEYQEDIIGHAAGEDIPEQDLITTSSFWFDYVLGGGYRSSCWSRFYSEPEQGKTAMGLTWARNWQQKYGEQALVVYFNAEGRLTRDALDRSGIDYSDKERFRVVWTNVYETIYGITEKLVLDDKRGFKVFVMIDSTDACCRKEDLKKVFGEAEKMAGGAAIASAAGKRMSVLFNYGGHHLYLCSQVRDKMATGPRAGGGKDASGGNAPKFYSSLVGNIKKSWTDTYLYENPSDKKSQHIGRMCEIKLEKTPNETTGKVVRIPIKYGLKGGIWQAYESMMIAQAWGIYIKEGNHWNINPEWEADFKKNKIPFEASCHGEKQLRTLFDTTPILSEYCLEKGKIFAMNDKMAGKIEDVEEADTSLADAGEL